MSRIPLEDNFNDIIGKTRRGLKIPEAELARRAGITPETLAALLDGNTDEDAIRAVAPVLGLRADSLVTLARGTWVPVAPSLSDGFAMFTTPYKDMTVNSFLLWDPETLDAAAFDTGASVDGLLEFARNKKLKIGRIFITHTHPDHVADLEKLAEETRAEVFTEEREPVKVPATTFLEGSLFRIGVLTVETLSTRGHSPGQTTFYVTGLEHPVAVVGDSLFAGSMGGSADHFADQLRNSGEKILTLPADTVIAPGHGPLSTVGQERIHNAFFAK